MKWRNRNKKKQSLWFMNAILIDFKCQWGTSCAVVDKTIAVRATRKNTRRDKTFYNSWTIEVVDRKHSKWIHRPTDQQWKWFLEINFVSEGKRISFCFFCCFRGWCSPSSSSSIPVSSGWKIWVSQNLAIISPENIRNSAACNVQFSSSPHENCLFIRHF